MTTASLDLLQFQSLSQVDGIVHGISTRQGGVSEGRCATLNTSYTVDDERERVDENLRRLASAFGREQADLYWAYQVHGREGVVVDGEAPPRPKCDILLTDTPERVLLLRYADCTPILLADPVRRVVAVAHAGWRGTAVRTASASVNLLRERFGTDPGDLLAGIGPAIGPCCYTVGQDVVDAFGDRKWAIVRAGEETRLDLWEANRRGLIESGVPESQIEMANVCTQCEAERFFSHRANSSQPAGRFAAVIALT